MSESLRQKAGELGAAEAELDLPEVDCGSHGGSKIF